MELIDDEINKYLSIQIGDKQENRVLYILQVTSNKEQSMYYFRASPYQSM